MGNGHGTSQSPARPGTEKTAMRKETGDRMGDSCERQKRPPSYWVSAFRASDPSSCYGDLARGASGRWVT